MAGAIEGTQVASPGLLRLAAITAADDWAAFQKMTALAAEPRQLFSFIGGEHGTSLLMHGCCDRPWLKSPAMLTVTP